MKLNVIFVLFFAVWCSEDKKTEEPSEFIIQMISCEKLLILDFNRPFSVRFKSDL